jgi:hypothetical protein
VRIDRPVFQEQPGPVDGGELTARAEAGVDAQDGALSGRGGEEQVPEVLAEDVEGLVLGLRPGLPADLGLRGRGEQALEGVGGRLPEERSRRAFRMTDDAAFEKGQCLVPGKFERDPQDLVPLPAEHGQEPVGRDLGNSFPVVAIHIVLGLLVGEFLADGDLQEALPAGQLPELLPCVGVVGRLFSQDVAGAAQGFFGRLKAFRGIDELRGFALQVRPGGLEPFQPAGQRLQAGVPGFGGPGHALGFKGKIEVLELGLAHRPGDLRFERGR